MLNVLDKLGKAEGFNVIYGLGALAPIVPGSRQADAFALWEQVQGKAFLEAFSTLATRSRIFWLCGMKLRGQVGVYFAYGRLTGMPRALLYP